MNLSTHTDTRKSLKAASDSSDTKAARRTAVASAGLRAATFPVTAISTFITTALVIAYTGPTQYGALMVVSTLSQLIPFADLGIGAGVINAVSGSRESGRRAVAAGLRLLLISSILITSTALIVTCTIGWPQLLSVQNAGIPGFDLTAGLAVFIIGLSIPLGLGQRVLVALLKNPLAIALAATAPVVSLFGVVLIVVLHLPAAFLAITTVVGSSVAAALMFVVSMKKLSFSLSDVWRVRSVRYPGLLTIGIWYLILSVCSALIFQSGRVVLAHTGSPSDLADYSIVMQFYMPIWSFILAAGTGIWPIFAKRRNLGEDASRIRSRITLLLASSGAASGLMLIAFGPLLAHFISGGLLQPDWPVFVSAGILLLVQSVQLVQGVYMTSAAGIRFQACWSVPLAVLTPLAVFSIAPEVGAVAPFAAASAGVVALQILPNIFFIRHSERKAAE